MARAGVRDATVPATVRWRPGGYLANDEAAWRAGQIDDYGAARVEPPYIAEDQTGKLALESSKCLADVSRAWRVSRLSPVSSHPPAGQRIVPWQISLEVIGVSWARGSSPTATRQSQSSRDRVSSWAKRRISFCA